MGHSEGHFPDGQINVIPNVKQTARSETVDVQHIGPSRAMK
jgi:hypothetical protein